MLLNILDECIFEEKICKTMLKSILIDASFTLHLF